MNRINATWIVLGLACVIATAAVAADGPSSDDIAMVGGSTPSVPGLPPAGLPPLAPPEGASAATATTTVDGVSLPVPVPAPVDEILSRLGDDPALYGDRVSVHDSGFNPDTDSPDFNNFGSFFSRGGNCMGMAYTAQQFYLHVRFDASGKADEGKAVREFREALLSFFVNVFGIHPHFTVHGFANLREASKDEKVGKSLHTLAELGQLHNLSPSLFGSLVAHNDWSDQLEHLINNMDIKRPAILALDRPGHMGGHAILAYKVVEYQKKVLVFVYDSNAGPTSSTDTFTYVPGTDDTTYKTVLVFDKATRKIDFHQAYKAILSYDYTNIVVFQMPLAKDISEDTVRVLTKDIPKAIKHILPITPLEKGVALVLSAGSFIRQHLGLPF